MWKLRSLKGILAGALLFFGIIIIFFANHTGDYRKTPVYTYKIINTYPHDSTAYTQGLFFADGVLYEGTGLAGQRLSMLGRVELESGNILQKIELPKPLFGEGVAVLGERIFQLTWKSNLGFVYDKKTLRKLQEFYYPTEGWGLTSDQRQLIMSDGSSSLYFLDPKTFQKTNQIEAYDNSGSVRGLNELEYINGEVFANVYETDNLAAINPHTGKVLYWINLNGALDLFDRIRGAGVLNGIAYDKENNRLFVTGKLWPKLFEIKLISWEQNSFEFVMRTGINSFRLTAQNAILLFVRRAKKLYNRYLNLSFDIGNWTLRAKRVEAPLSNG